MRHLGKRTSIIFSLIVIIVAVLFIDFNKDSFVLLLVINQIAFFIVGIKYDQSKTKAERDQLTNLYNRMFISDKLPKMLKVRSNMSICIVDIDSFKAINDTHGHLVGDDVIKTIASVLISETRKTDIVVRWGGDEFLIVANDLNYDSLLSLNDRINDRLNEIAKRYGFPISVSMGFASCCSKDKDIEAIIQLADENMYFHKREKQNRLKPRYS